MPAARIREFVQRVVQVFGCDAAAFYYLPGEEVFRSGPESNPVTDHDLLAAAEVDELSVDAGAHACHRAGPPGRPSLGSHGAARPLPSEQTLRAIVNLVAITIEKARALEDASHAEAARQSEVLKSALLDSLAHDIKTPLTSIKAAVTSLLGSAGRRGSRTAHHHQRRGRPAEPAGRRSGRDGAHRGRQTAPRQAAGGGGGADRGARWPNWPACAEAAR